MKRTIEIQDTLQERVDCAIDEVKSALVDYIKENDCDETPDMSDLDYSGTIHEIVDGSVPIYSAEVKDTWYLNREDLVAAYDNAGVGNNPMENDGMVAIYFYIMDKVNEWYSYKADDIFEEIKADREAAVEN